MARTVTIGRQVFEATHELRFVITWTELRLNPHLPDEHRREHGVPNTITPVVETIGRAYRYTWRWA